MKGKDLLSGMSFVNSKYIDESENAAFPEKTTLSIRRPFLLAAVIALLLCLVGCAVVYVLSMQDVKIGEATATRDYRLVDGTYVEDPHEVNQNVLTLAGLKGTNAYQACADYFAFKEEYTKNMKDMMTNGTLPEDFFENNSYGKAMEAKAAELVEQYGLKLEGEILDFRTTRNMCDALGVERFLRDSQELSAEISSGCCYETGNFSLDLNFNFPEDQGYELLTAYGLLRWNRADCFSTDYESLVDSGDWVERNYTTSSGSNVLILQSPSQEYGYILCDRGAALMSLRLTVNRELLSEADGVVSVEYQRMTDKQIELVADTVDFGVQPSVPTQADVDAQAEIPQASTQNGWTVALKSVETDGYVAQIVVSITAPEDMDIENLDLSFGGYGPLQSASGVYASGAFNDIEDGDGKANTKDMLMLAQAHMEEDAVPFAPGSTWNVHIVDIEESWWDSANVQRVENTLVEGEWLFPITFDETNGDYREIELVTEPIKATACTGWKMDGTDVLHEFTVTSFKLRKFSSSMEWERISYMGDDRYGDSADFYDWTNHHTYAVMKDGTQIRMNEDRNEKPIDIDELDYVQLADGTRLMAP